MHQPKFSCRNDRMINFTAGILDGSFNIFFYKIRQLFQYLLMAQTGRKEIQYVNDADSHSSDTWPSATLIRIGSNALSPVFHFG